MSHKCTAIVFLLCINCINTIAFSFIYLDVAPMKPVILSFIQIVNHYYHLLTTDINVYLIISSPPSHLTFESIKNFCLLSHLC